MMFVTKEASSDPLKPVRPAGVKLRCHHHGGQGGMGMNLFKDFRVPALQNPKVKYDWPWRLL